MEELTLFDVLPIAFLTIYPDSKAKNSITVGLRPSGEERIYPYFPDGTLLNAVWLVEPAIYKKLERLVKEHSYRVVALYEEDGERREDDVSDFFFSFAYDEVLKRVKALYLYYHTKDLDFVKRSMNLSAEDFCWLEKVKGYADVTPAILTAVVDSDKEGKAELGKLNALVLERKLGKPLRERDGYFKVLNEESLRDVIVGRELGDFLPLFEFESYYPVKFKDNLIGWIFQSLKRGKAFVPNLEETEELLNEFLKDYELIRNFRNSPLEYSTNLSFVPNEVYREFERLSIKYGLKEVSAQAFGVNLVKDLEVDLLPDGKLNRLIKEGVFYRKRTYHFDWLPDLISLKKENVHLADLLYLYHEGMTYLPFVMLEGKRYVLSKEQVDQIEPEFRKKAYEEGRKMESVIVNKGVSWKDVSQKFGFLIGKLSRRGLNVWDKTEGIDGMQSVIVAVSRRDTYRNRLSREEVKAIVNDLKGDFSYGFDYVFVKVPIEVYREGLNFSDYSVVGLENEKGETYYVKPADRQVLEAELTGGVKQL